MKKKSCITLKSTCLFGACAFTLDTLLKLWNLIFSILLIGYNWKKYGNLVVRTQVINAFFDTVYITFSMILVFYLFRGIFMKLPGVIKLGALFILVLRLWECSASLVSWDDTETGFSGGPQIRDEFGVYKTAKIAGFIVTNLSAAAFVAVLFLYYRHLEAPRQRQKKQAGSGTSSSSVSI